MPLSCDRNYVYQHTQAYGDMSGKFIARFVYVFLSDKNVIIAGILPNRQVKRLKLRSCDCGIKCQFHNNQISEWLKWNSMIRTNDLTVSN